MDKPAYGKDTFKTFGCKDDQDYLHKYSIAGSIANDITLPLYYQKPCSPIGDKTVGSGGFGKNIENHLTKTNTPYAFRIVNQRSISHPLNPTQNI